MGTILFGVWSIVKTISMFLLDKTVRMAMLKQMLEANGVKWEARYYTIAIILAVVILGVDLIFRSFIGWAAISEGRGKRRSILYIIVACMVLWSSFWTITGLTSDYRDMLMQLTAPAPEGTPGKEPTISAIIIEITSFIMLIEMIYASIRVKKLTRRKKGQAKHGR